MNVHTPTIAGLPHCLSHLAHEPRWVGWKWEDRANKDGTVKRTKPPFQANGRYAHNDKPETWASLPTILASADRNGFCGFGLQLLNLKGFAALDLDKVRNPETGMILPWAAEVIACGSYAEMTPSGTGFRVLGTVAPDHPPRHRKFQHPEGGEIEFYISLPEGSGRYITVTGDRVPAAPDALRQVDHVIASLWATVQPEERGDSGFSFDAGNAKGFDDLPEKLRNDISHGVTDDRSGDFQSIVNRLFTLVDYATALRILEAHPEGPAGKYAGRLDKELRRSWGKAAEPKPRPKARPKPRAEMPTAALDDVELTEDGVALAFTERFGGTLRFDHDAGAWFEWMGDHWRQDGTGLAFAWCREVARGASADADDRDRATVRRKSFAAGVEAFVRTDRAHAVRQNVWDTDPFLLGVPGGVVDLRTGRLNAPAPEQGITKLAAVPPADRADCPLWLAFLTEACGGDGDVVAFLRRWCGYCLTGDTREHALIFLYGPGGNGKSVFLNTVARIIGAYATTAAMDTFTSSKGDKHPTELALLRGARMVSASETEEGRAWAEARIKQMTGGDPITARFMHKDFFTYRPSFKLTIVGNHAPALANVDDAARRRFNIVPFVHKPVNPDRQLEDKLVAEWPAILRWMIDGTGEWLRNGLQQPESVRAATADYFSEQDMVAQWLAEDCTLTPANPTHFETNDELFKSWTDFAHAAGETVGSKKAMAPRLRRHGLRDKSIKVQGKTHRCWIGVQILNRKEKDHD